MPWILNVLYLSFSKEIPQIQSIKINQKWIQQLLCVCIKGWCCICDSSSSICQKLLKTHQRTTLLLWVTCAFIQMNMGTLYFESIPHALSCCHKYSLENEMCIKLQLFCEITASFADKELLLQVYVWSRNTLALFSLWVQSCALFTL